MPNLSIENWIERFRGRIGNGAGDGNRTRTASLGSWSSTIELRPPVMIRTDHRGRLDARTIPGDTSMLGW